MVCERVSESECVGGSHGDGGWYSMEGVEGGGRSTAVDLYHVVCGDTMISRLTPAAAYERPLSEADAITSPGRSH